MCFPPYSYFPIFLTDQFHVFWQPMKVAPIIHFYIPTALTERDDWFLYAKQQINDQLGTGTQPASRKVRI